MTKKDKAIQLRKQGKSYSQIAKELLLSKSTLSDWLSYYPLKKEDIKRLRDLNPQRIAKYKQTMATKRNAIMSALKQKEYEYLHPLSNKELFIAGLFLYWGEGGKTANWRINLSNSDPQMIKFFIKWATTCLGVPDDDFRVLVHLYSNMSVEQELIYWSKILKIPKKQFFRPYIKNTSSDSIKHKNSFGHGTCNISVNNANIARRVLAALESIKLL